jgi:hypothetical protein
MECSDRREEAVNRRGQALESSEKKAQGVEDVAGGDGGDVGS